MHQFQIIGMTCNHCVQVITEAVEAVDETAKVEADTASGKVKVYSSRPAEAFKKAITDAGYTVMQ